MTKSHGLDIDKKSHPRLLMLTNRIAWDTQQGYCLPACSPKNPRVTAQSLRVSDAHNLEF
jgi:hypothetical protein